MAYADNNQPKLVGIRAVVFDVFGTLVSITSKRRPYAQLISRASPGKNTSGKEMATLVMSTNMDLAETAELLECAVSIDDLTTLEHELALELMSIEPYPEMLETIKKLKDRGLAIGLCSNLAAPYAPSVKGLLPFTLDSYSWSFDVGAIKPDARIYANVCQQLGLLPQQILFIGDTYAADYLGPTTFGMHALHLDRQSNGIRKNTISALDQILEII